MVGFKILSVYLLSSSSDRFKNEPAEWFEFAEGRVRLNLTVFRVSPSINYRFQKIILFRKKFTPASIRFFAKNENIRD